VCVASVEGHTIRQTVSTYKKKHATYTFMKKKPAVTRDLWGSIHNQSQKMYRRIPITSHRECEGVTLVALVTHRDASWRPSTKVECPPRRGE
jgi:hypothetical protein